VHTSGPQRIETSARAGEALFLHPQNQHDDFVVTVEGNPAFALLHDDPVYRQLISSMGLPAQN